MPITYQCRACGCAVSDRQLRSGLAKREGQDIYCVECSALIVDPGEPPAPEMDQQQAGTPPYGQPLHQRPVGSGRRPAPEAPRRQGSELAAAPRTMARPAGPSARQAEPPARRPAPSARQAVAQPAARAIEPSARRHGSSQRVEPEARQRPSSHRFQPGTGKRAPAQQAEPPPPPASASRRSAGARPSRRAQAPEPEFTEVQEEETIDFSSSSSRMRSRNNAEQGEMVEERRGRHSIRGNASGERKSKAPLIAMISGGLILIGLVALMSGAVGGSKTKPRAKTEEEKTPQELERLAEEELRSGRKMSAHEYLMRASEAWREQGQEKDAQRCVMLAKNVGFSTTINDYKR